jgi:drug/metabolite transporter (DMT)-like permease
VPHRPLPPLAGEGQGGGTQYDRAFQVTPSPPLPRLRGREQTELVARADSISPKSALALQDDENMNPAAVLAALASAALFGVSTPAAKALLGVMDPVILAGLLYCGAGIGIALLRTLAGPILNAPAARQQPLERRDYRWLAGAIAFGGVAGPVLLMLGLSRTPAATASLLLTVEGAATALLAWFVFHENFDRRIALGMACLIAGAAIVSWSGTPTAESLIGPLAIIGACIAWGIDNNLTRKVSLADPLQIVQLKGLIAGPVNLLLGLWAGASLPGPLEILAGGLVGFVCYGLSLALFVIALRHLGAARTGAYFSTAPFIGAATAVVALQQPLTVQLLAAGALMAVGVWLHITERHQHAHSHGRMVHAHSHSHDEHHSHAHGPQDPPGEPHTHAHEHEALTHSHPHMPDMHHDHRH